MGTRQNQLPAGELQAVRSRLCLSVYCSAVMHVADFVRQTIIWRICYDHVDIHELKLISS